MSLFCKGNTSVYHVHIPRTGGRFITQMLMANDYDVFHAHKELHLYGIQCFHLHYPLYEYLEGVDKSLQIAVVRNPFDRFRSEISNIFIKRKYTQEEMLKIEDYDFFCYLIGYERMTHHYYKNWFRPQHEFIGPNNLIWRFEDGLGKPFRSWFHELTGDELVDKEYSYYGDEEVELNPDRKEFQLTEKMRENVAKYYEQDLIQFNY